MWLAGGLLVTWTVNENSRSVDLLLAQAAASGQMQVNDPGPGASRRLLHYAVDELCRSELRRWEFAQLGLGGFFVLFMLFGTREGKFALVLSGLLLVAVLAQCLFLFPEVLSLGRLSDLLPDAAGAGYRARLLVMEGAYLGVEITKWVIGAVLAGILISRGRGRSSHPSEGVWNQFHVVDKANHGHIDR